MKINLGWIVYLLIVVFILFAFLVVSFVFYQIWKGISIKRLEYRRYFSEEGAFEGDEIYFIEELSNHSLLPMFHIHVESYISSNIRLKGVQRADDINQHFVSSFSVVLPFTKIRRSHVAVCKKRGFYRLETAKVEFAQMDLYLESKAQLFVYPKELTVEEKQGLNRYLQYASYAKLPLMEDVFSFSGVREYQSGDAMNRMNYKASAKKGMFMVNERDYVMGKKLMVYLNFQMADKYVALEEFERLMEQALSYAAFIFGKAWKEGYQIGLGANCQMVNGDKYVRYPLSVGYEHYRMVLQELAMARPIYGNSFCSIIDMDIDEYLEQAEVYLITSYLDEAIDQRIETLQSLGNVVEVLMVDAQSLEGNGFEEKIS